MEEGIGKGIQELHVQECMEADVKKQVAKKYTSVENQECVQDQGGSRQ